MANEKVLITEQLLRDIAQAIYNKGRENNLTPSNFAAAIMRITTGDVPSMELDNGYIEAIYTLATKNLELRNRA